MDYKKMWYTLLAETQLSAFHGTDAIKPGATSVLNDMINIECKEFSDSIGKRDTDGILPG